VDVDKGFKPQKLKMQENQGFSSVGVSAKSQPTLQRKRRSENECGQMRKTPKTS
jgi:hypothetical protein